MSLASMDDVIFGFSSININYPCLSSYDITVILITEKYSSQNYNKYINPRLWLNT